MPPSAKPSAVRDVSATLRESAARDAGPRESGTRDVEAPSFETALSRLSEIVERLEGAELPLEESLRLFEEGVSLSRVAQLRLNAAEKRVEELLAINEDGSPVVRDLGADER